MESKNIHSRDRAKQLIVFDGMVYERNIRPTDIDGAIDFGDLLFCYFEIKYNNTQIEYGQRKALERFTTAAIESGRQAIALICQHFVHNVEDDVFAKDTIVREVFWQGQWKPPRKKMTLINAIDYFRGMPMPGKKAPIERNICEICHCALIGWEMADGT